MGDGTTEKFSNNSEVKAPFLAGLVPSVPVWFAAIMMACAINAEKIVASCLFGGIAGGFVV